MIYYAHNFPLSSIERGDIITLPGIALEVRQTTLSCVDKGLQGLLPFWSACGLGDASIRGAFFTSVYGRQAHGTVFPEFATVQERVAICNAIVELVSGRKYKAPKQNVPRIIDRGGNVFDIIIGTNKIRIHSPFFQIKEIQNATVDNKKSGRFIQHKV